MGAVESLEAPSHRRARKEDGTQRVPEGQAIGEDRAGSIVRRTLGRSCPTPARLASIAPVVGMAKGSYLVLVAVSSLARRWLESFIAGCIAPNCRLLRHPLSPASNYCTSEDTSLRSENNNLLWLERRHCTHLKQHCASTHFNARSHSLDGRTEKARLAYHATHSVHSKHYFVPSRLF